VRVGVVLQFLLVLVVAVACSIHFGDLNERAEKTGTIEFAVSDGITSLVVETFNGSLKIHAAEGDRLIRGESKIMASGKTIEDAQARLTQMAWVYSESGNVGRLYLTRPDHGANNAGGSLKELALPAGVALDLHSSNGSIRVGRGFADVTARSSNGSLDVETDGIARLETSNGNIDLTGDCQDFELDSSNGRITVQLTGDWSGHGTATSSNGRIAVRCDGVLDCRLDMKTSNGKPKVLGPPLDDHSGKGSLRLRSSNAHITVTHLFDKD
jgi:DUF4097 and DUF4098 domain-containing protein YvlB